MFCSLCNAMYLSGNLWISRSCLPKIDWDRYQSTRRNGMGGHTNTEVVQYVVNKVY